VGGAEEEVEGWGARLLAEVVEVRFDEVSCEV